MEVASLESDSTTTFFLLLFLLLLLLFTSGRFLVELRKVTRKTGPSASLGTSTSPRHFSGFSVPAPWP